MRSSSFRWCRVIFTDFVSYSESCCKARFMVVVFYGIYPFRLVMLLGLVFIWMSYSFFVAIYFVLILLAISYPVALFAVETISLLLSIVLISTFSQPFFWLLAFRNKTLVEVSFIFQVTCLCILSNSYDLGLPFRLICVFYKFW